MSQLIGVQNMLDVLAVAAWDFMVATFVLAMLTAVVLEAARDFGLRAVLHWYYVRNFRLVSYPIPWSMLSLAPDELCGQIALTMQTELEEKYPSSTREFDEMESEKRREFSMMERMTSFAKTPCGNDPFMLTFMVPG